MFSMAFISQHITALETYTSLWYMVNFCNKQQTKNMITLIFAQRYSVAYLLMLLAQQMRGHKSSFFKGKLQTMQVTCPRLLYLDNVKEDNSCILADIKRFRYHMQM